MNRFDSSTPRADRRESTAAIEPGVLPLFRIFVTLELLLLLLRIGLETAFQSSFRLIGSPWPGVAFLALQLAYLSLPPLERRLGRAYLPAALLAATGFTLLAAASGMKLRAEAGIRAEELVRASWILFVVPVVPLIIVAWQYGTRWSVRFCVLTTAAELALMVPVASSDRRLALALLLIALVRLLLFLPVGYGVATLAQTQRRQRAALAAANARLARHASTLEELAISRERNRLAYELHDTLAHGLSSLAVQLEAMSVLWTAQPEKVRAMLADALAGTRTALGEARRAIAALRARPLDELGLAQALRKLAETTAAQAGLELDLRVPAPLDGLRTEAEDAIYRIAAEALVNVVRHAQARRIAVCLEAVERGVRLVVADDGRGFDPATASEADHFGLYGMQERARSIGGELTIESAPGHGTTVRLALRRQDEDDSRPDM